VLIIWWCTRLYFNIILLLSKKKEFQDISQTYQRYILQHCLGDRVGTKIPVSGLEIPILISKILKSNDVKLWDLGTMILHFCKPSSWRDILVISIWNNKTFKSKKKISIKALCLAIRPSRKGSCLLLDRRILHSSLRRRRKQRTWFCIIFAPGSLTLTVCIDWWHKDYWAVHVR